MAPEVERGEAVTAAADVYSLGVAFLRLLTGAWYDKNPEAIKKLSTRKYDWIPVLSEMLAPVDRRPTVLAKFPIKLSQRVTTKFRQAGTWKIVLADKKKKSKLFEEVEKARIRREKLELKKQKLKKILIAATIAEAALFAGIAYYAYVPHKGTPGGSAGDHPEADPIQTELRIKREYQDLLNTWNGISCRHKLKFSTELQNIQKNYFDNLAFMYGDVDYADKISTTLFEEQIRKVNKVIDKFDQNCNAWKSIYYLSGECVRLIAEAKQMFEDTKNPRLSEVLRIAEDYSHMGNLHKTRDEYVEAKADYECCIKILKDFQYSPK